MNDAIVISNLSKHYSNGKGISKVNLSVKAGEIFGFLGPNGAGKTTTIRSMMDFIRPDSGSVKILGLDSVKDSVAVKRQIGYVPSDKQLYTNWTGKQHIDFYQDTRGQLKVDVAKKLDLDLSIPVRHLSSGNKQKLALSVALAGDPKLLIMDEPTLGLDPLLQQAIYAILEDYKKDGGTVFLSSHNLPEVEKICDRVGIIKDGTIIADKSMQDIRDMSIHIVSISAKKPLKIEAGLKNVKVLHQSGNHLVLNVKGDLNSLLKLITSHPVHDLEITHANLEDIFLEYYS